MDLTVLAPDPVLLLCAVVLDGLLGDPVYRWHPVRLMGHTLTAMERMLRRIGLDGYAGGCMLFLALSVCWVGVSAALAFWLNGLHPVLNGVYQVFVIYSMVALRDLCRHGMAIDRAGDLKSARRAVSMLVGRDTSAMDAAACRRAGMESLSENAVDGFIAPLCWYALLGLPGIVLYKVISTMDSMVGYRTPRYARFGWCGARLDDLFNLIPARLTYLLLAGGRVSPAWVFEPQGSVGWLATARAGSGPEFRMERSGGGRCRAAAPGRSGPSGREAGYRDLDRRRGRSGRRPGRRPAPHVRPGRGHLPACGNAHGMDGGCINRLWLAPIVPPG